MRNGAPGGAGKMFKNNCGFPPKNTQIRIVGSGDFSYFLGIRCRTVFRLKWHHDYVEYC
jgi:hypothetical protein